MQAAAVLSVTPAFPAARLLQQQLQQEVRLLPVQRCCYTPPLPCNAGRASRDAPAFPIGRRIHVSRKRDSGAGSWRPFSVQAQAQAKWVLEPIGDGDMKHLDSAIPLPGALVLESNAVTVGRVPERADIVLPVATVSGLHARLEVKGATLFVTDLDSTNGTFVDGKKLRPGAVTVTYPNSSIVFGDEHLAAYRVSLVEETQESEAPAPAAAADQTTQNSEAPAPAPAAGQTTQKSNEAPAATPSAA